MLHLTHLPPFVPGKDEYRHRNLRDLRSRRTPTDVTPSDLSEGLVQLQHFVETSVNRLMQASITAIMASIEACFQAVPTTPPTASISTHLCHRHHPWDRAWNHHAQLACHHQPACGLVPTITRMYILDPGPAISVKLPLPHPLSRRALHIPKPAGTMINLITTTYLTYLRVTNMYI